MDKIIFTSASCSPEKLYPFTLTRHIHDIRVGILTISEKWQELLDAVGLQLKEDNHKDNLFSVTLAEAVKTTGTNYSMDSNLLPTPGLVKAIRRLKAGDCLTADDRPFVHRFTANNLTGENEIGIKRFISFNEEIKTIQHPWDIFQLNDWAIRNDFEWLTAKRKSQPISKTNKVIKPSQVFIEKGAKVEHCIINAATGPVYIGRNAEVMEGCIIRGPFAMGPESCLKLGTKVYGATTLGPNCVVGGEIKNSVLFSYSNKAHDGYLGDSVIGEWCNMGAGTTNSNLKNNAGNVNIYTPDGPATAGKKCGVMMGDYSRTAINTAINTGTVIGVCCNVFGAGLTPKHIPNFSWGCDGQNRYNFSKALMDINNWKQLKGQNISDREISFLKHIFDQG